MSEILTKKYLEDALKGLATTKDIQALDVKIEKLNIKVTTKIDTAEERLAESIRSINFSLTEHLARMEGKLDYIAQNASLRQELRNLVSQLKAQGVKLDESKIFIV